MDITNFLLEPEFTPHAQCYRIKRDSHDFCTRITSDRTYSSGSIQWKNSKICPQIPELSNGVNPPSSGISVFAPIWASTKSTHFLRPQRTASEDEERHDTKTLYMT